MEKTLKELIAEGFATVSHDSLDDTVVVSKRRFSRSTGAEIAPEDERTTRAEIEYFITMRQSQLVDLQEILKAFPVKVIKKG